ncbi:MULTISPECIES: Clp protease N-terminal domain-containing protein [unclassified Streptomyces]|uniref:Clp protease N-terminal domain-containing protein n=1 Tax=unclassified Streptomyces TaxID=2593676 RepID=UPI0038169F89
MFERFTKDARDVVRGAYVRCEEAGERRIGPEHLLLALLDGERGRGAFALTALGLGAERRAAVREGLLEARRRAGLSRSDADALAGLGIDVAEVVARVEEAHGVGALAGVRRGGRVAFGREAKGVLEQALRMAVAHRDRHIGDEHLLLALAVRPGVWGECLADHGVTYEGLLGVLYGGGVAEAS